MNFKNPWDFDGAEAAKALDSPVLDSEREVNNAKVLFDEQVLDSIAVYLDSDKAKYKITNFNFDKDKVSVWLNGDLSEDTEIFEIQNIDRVAYLAPSGILIIAFPVEIEYNSKKYFKVIFWNEIKFAFGCVLNDRIKFKKSEVNWSKVNYNRSLAHYIGMLLHLYKNDPLVKNGTNTLHPDIVEDCENFLIDLNNKKLIIDDDTLSQIQSSINENLTTDTDETLKVVSGFKSAILKHYGHSSDLSKTIILPFNENWFHSRVELKATYDKITKNVDGFGALHRFNGFSAEGLQPSNDEFAEAIQKLEVIKQLVIDKNYSDPISAWLKSVDFSNCNRLFFISNFSWSGYTSDTKIADQIGINLSLLNLEIKPIYQILAHELNVNRVIESKEKFFPPDTHIAVDSLKKAIEFIMDDDSYMSKDPQSIIIKLSQSISINLSRQYDFGILLQQLPAFSLFWIYLILRIWRK